MIDLHAKMQAWPVPAGVRSFQKARLEKTNNPCYLYDSSLIKRHCAQFLAIPYEPKSLHFATMANSNRDFLRLVRHCGLSFFVNSLTHLQEVVKAGAEGESIVFAASAMDDEAMRQTHQYGVQVNLDSLSQLQRWSELFPESSVGIRCDISSVFGTGQSAGECHQEHRNRLGLIPEEIIEVAGHPQVNVLHIYLGTGLLDVDYLVAGYNALLEFVELFPNLTALDLGGGFGVPESGAVSFDMETYGHRVSQLMMETSHRLRRRLRLMLEPGRIIGGSAGYFLCEVSDIKQRPDHQLIGVRASCAQFPRPLLHPDNARHPVALLREGESVSGELQPSSVFGCSTYSRDFLGRDVALPRARVGDWVVFGNAGSYCAAAHTRFLGFPAAEEFFL